LDTKLGRTSLRCSVMLNGALQGETAVIFVPEKSHDNTMRVATGRTDENGNAIPSIP
jgi:hypothetical protein